MARAIDAALLALGTTVIGIVGWIIGANAGMEDDFLNLWGSPPPTGFTAEQLGLLLTTAAFVALISIEVLMTAWTGRSFGKRLAKITVVDVSGRPVTVAQSARRLLLPSAVAAVVGTALGMLLSSAGVWLASEPTADHLLAVGYLTAWLWLPATWLLLFVSGLPNRDRRGWHDRVAGTIVVRDGAIPKALHHRPWQQFKRQLRADHLAQYEADAAARSDSVAEQGVPGDGGAQPR